MSDDKSELENIKNIPWDKLSQKEASRMYSVLHNNKSFTNVKTNKGSVEVNSDFANKMHKKHLDNPDLRGMVTTEETISFPKIAKNIEAKSDIMGNTWNIKSIDNKYKIIYGSRDWNTGEKLITVHSKTEYGVRASYTDIKSPIFDTPSNKEIIPNSDNKVKKKPFKPTGKYKSSQDKDIEK